MNDADSRNYQDPNLHSGILSRLVFGQAIHAKGQHLPHAPARIKASPVPALPSFPAMAKNAILAGVEEAKAVIAGENALTDSEVESRFAACKTCEFFIPDTERCSKCGCFMEYKTRLRGQKCPVGKW